MYIRLFREAAAGGAGGGTEPLSLSDIEKRIADKMSGKEPVVDPVVIPPIKSGDGKDKLPDLTDKDKIPEGKKLDADGKTLIDDPEYKKPDPVIDPKAPVVDPVVDDGDADDSDDPLAFWEDVNKRTGIPVKVEYPEGIDPISPEGVVLRETVVRDQAVAMWEDSLKERYPRAYAYMMHHMEGGSDAEFLNNERGVSLPDRVTVEGSIELQTNLYKNDLLNKGVDPDIVEAQLANTIKKNQLGEKALGIYDGILKDQQAELSRIEVRNKQAAEQFDKIVKTVSTKVEQSLPNLGFVVPEARKTDFLKYVDDHMQYDRGTGKTYLVLDFDPENPKTHLEAMAFQFLGGDLNKIVQQKVTTKASQRLRQQADKTKVRQPTSQQDDTGKDTFVPLSQMGGFAPKK